MLKIKKMHEKAILPHYATDGSSAFDLFCYEEPEWESNIIVDNINVENIKRNVLACHTALIHTGWAFEIPEDYGMFILSRSGHGFNFLTSLANSVGLIDNDYRGEVMVKLICFEKEPPEIKAGQAIAQAVILHTPKQYFEVVNELTKTKRGDNGFGSTDKRTNNG